MENHDSQPLPNLFIQKISEYYDEQTAERIIEGSIAQRKVSLRSNLLKSSNDEIASALAEAGIEYTPVPWFSDAFLITSAREREIWQLEEYKQGKLYMQSLSSMLPPVVLDPQPGQDILDMCAAPGGKTTQMASMGGKETHITACEMNAPRAEKLRFNLDRQGASNVMVMQEDARKLSEFFRFDKILIDAPCSGSGTLRAHDPKIHKRFTPKLIEKCVKSQRALLQKGLSLLKPGGTLVYSTCSVFPEENEDQVIAALSAAKKMGSFSVEPMEIPGFDGIPPLPCKLENAMTVCPTSEYEGFFVCKIVRKA